MRVIISLLSYYGATHIDAEVSYMEYQFLERLIKEVNSKSIENKHEIMMEVEKTT